MMNPLYPKIAICGIGSVTVTILHALSQNKVPFTILCKDKKRFQNLKDNPLSFKGPNGIITQLDLKDHLTLVQDHNETYDFIFLGCKNQNLNDYISMTASNLNPNGKWILIQNGLPESYFPNYLSKLVGGVVGWNTQVLENGTYFQSNFGSLILGGLDQQILDPIWKTILEPCIQVVLTRQITGYRWHKLAINSIINGLAASKQSSLGQLFLKMEGRAEAISILTEIKNLMSHLKVKEEVVPGSFPIQKLGDGKGALPKWIRHLILITLGLKYFKIRTSMVQDLDNQRKTEIHYINGEIVKLGKSNGVPVSNNEKIVTIVTSLEEKFQT